MGGRRVNAGRMPSHPLLLDKSKRKESNKAIEDRIEEAFELDAKPEMPKGLTVKAQNIWNSVVELYENVYEATGKRLICVMDTDSLKSYCIYKDILDKLYSEYTKDENIYKVIKTKTKSKTETTTRDGENEKKVINPLFREIRQIETRLTLLASELCLTPTGRARMGLLIINNNKKKDKLDEFLEN